LTSKFLLNIISQNADVGDVPDHIVRLFDARNTIPDGAVTINGFKLFVAESNNSRITKNKGSET
jgi:hypothetical protein